MEELIDKLNGLELMVQAHDERDELVMNFLKELGEILQQTGAKTTVVLTEIENEYVKFLETLDIL